MIPEGRRVFGNFFDYLVSTSSGVEVGWSAQIEMAPKTIPLPVGARRNATACSDWRLISVLTIV